MRISDWSSDVCSSDLPAKRFRGIMRIIYMGTPDFAVPTLEMLVKAGHEVIAVYSQPPRPAGRGKALRPTPVHARAEAMGLEVRTPVSLKDADVQTADGKSTRLNSCH